MAARELDLNVIGLSLARNSKEKSLEEIFLKSRDLIATSESHGFRISTLIIPEVLSDLSTDSFEQHLTEMQEIAQKLKKQNRNLEIFCETHDSLTTSSLSIFLTIQAVRRIPVENSSEGEKVKVQYFVDDGRHNSFRKVPRCVRHVKVSFVRRSASESEKLFASEIFGPSCDGDDIILDNVPLPELKNGDLICLRNVGSDTISARNNFNGFENCKVFHFMQRSELLAEQLC